MKPEHSLRLYTRRQALRALGTLPAAALFGCDHDLSLQTDAIAASIPGCVLRPEQTEGPYFIDEKLNRSDIRSDPSDKSIKPGVPLRLEFQVSTVTANSCGPLSGAMVDVWHCDALGVYSDVQDSVADSRGKKFLRGYQVTDEKGIANFLTVSIPAGMRGVPCTYTSKSARVLQQSRASILLRNSISMTRLRIEFTALRRTNQKAGGP